jgi:hypothetical protein
VGRRLAQENTTLATPTLMNYYQAVLLLEAAFDEVRQPMIQLLN